MRRVKFQDTGEYGTDESGYKAPNKKYYSSKAAYDAMVRNTELYHEIYEKLQEILETPAVPSVVLKAVNEHKGRYGIVLEILLRYGETIREGIRTRGITNGFQVARYVRAFIENNYREIEKEFADLVAVKKQWNIEEPEDIPYAGHRHKYKNLTKLTGDI